MSSISLILLYNVITNSGVIFDSVIKSTGIIHALLNVNLYKTVTKDCYTVKRKWLHSEVSVDLHT